MVKKYIPDIGDIVWISCDPSAGNEHRGHRPAVIISPKEYNKLTNLCVCCPMTTKIKGYPFEVIIDDKSAVLTDQIKSLDWVVRKAKFKDKISSQLLQDIKNKIHLLLQI
ncbi:endoribonuclease MazF [Francisella sp. SYW-9]|uniref:endoribonuclease MazF n=1 Tax=Francisella sp. SYW-9 TaxID=2610888 RepID=UPI00123D534C|nr:endoribonuclease MazF [Francisella sp. SYW-9]